MNEDVCVRVCECEGMLGCVNEGVCVRVGV